MKLAFSTLGCPDFDWKDIYTMAKDFGFSGIELRGLGNDIFSVHARPFRKENLAQTKALLTRQHLEIPCLSTGCALKFPERRGETLAEIREYIDLAEQLGTPFIRILGDLTAGPGRRGGRRRGVGKPESPGPSGGEGRRYSAGGNQRRLRQTPPVSGTF